MSIFELTCNLAYDKIKSFISPLFGYCYSSFTFLSSLPPFYPPLSLSLLDTSGVIIL